jgi:predicted transcriptional regulator
MNESERRPHTISKWAQKETVPDQQKEVQKESVPHQKEVQKETIQNLKTAVRCKQQKQVLATNLNMASLKLVQLFQS